MTTPGSPGPRGFPSSVPKLEGVGSEYFGFTPRVSLGEKHGCTKWVASSPLAASAHTRCAASSHLEEGVSDSEAGLWTLSPQPASASDCSGGERAWVARRRPVGSGPAFRANSRDRSCSKSGESLCLERRC